MDWYQRAGDQSHPQALFNLGMLYFLGDGVEQDEQKAFSCFERSANENETRAQVFLGILYENGIVRDSPKAVSSYRKAAWQGDAFARFHLARMYYHGKGVAPGPRPGIALVPQGGRAGIFAGTIQSGPDVFEWRGHPN